MGDDEWEAEKYRGTHETEEHWTLRREFMVQNKGRYPEMRLVCLSQVFSNMEFLGCKYPRETMELVGELSQGIVEDYRSKQKNRLQRTFVKASDAAERKSKGSMPPSYQPRFAYINFIKATDDETQVENLESLLLASQLDPKPPKVIKKSNDNDGINRDVENLHISPEKPAEPKILKCAAEFPPLSEDIKAESSASSTQQKKLICNVYIPPAKRLQLAQQNASEPQPSISKTIPFQIDNSPIPQLAFPHENKPRKIPTHKERQKNNSRNPSHSQLKNEFAPPQQCQQNPKPSVASTSTAPKKTEYVNRNRHQRSQAPNGPSSSQYQNNHSNSEKNNGPQKYNLPHQKNNGPPKASTKNFSNNSQGNNQKFGQDDTVVGLILVEYGWLRNDPPYDLISRSCSICHKKLNVKYEEIVQPEITIIENGEVQSLLFYKCFLKIGNDFATEGCGGTKEESKQDAACNALDILKKKAYTILIKEQIHETKKINKEDCTTTNPLAPTKFESQAAPMANSNNIGNKLLRMMGWDGGALGKNGTGIEEPIDVSNSVGRNRLGLGSTEKSFGKKLITVGQFRSFLEQEIPDVNDDFDVVFSSDFTKEERKSIHTAALTLGCKSKSYGKDNNRFIVVSRKISIADLVKEIHEKGETEKYKIVLPSDPFPFMSLLN